MKKIFASLPLLLLMFVLVFNSSVQAQSNYTKNKSWAEKEACRKKMYLELVGRTFTAYPSKSIGNKPFYETKNFAPYVNDNFGVKSPEKFTLIASYGNDSYDICYKVRFASGKVAYVEAGVGVGIHESVFPEFYGENYRILSKNKCDESTDK